MLAYNLGNFEVFFRPYPQLLFVVYITSLYALSPPWYILAFMVIDINLLASCVCEKSCVPVLIIYVLI